MSDATLPPGRYRDYDNQATIIAPVVRPAPPRPSSTAAMRELFLRHYAAIRRTLMGFPHPGILIVAIDPWGASRPSQLCMAADPVHPTVAIVGRHTHADLCIDPDPELSLRHLAVLVDAAPEGVVPGMRLIDLRTPLGFQDEHGRPCRSLVTNGPMLLRCGLHVLFLLVTGPRLQWPEQGEDAWAELPPREPVEQDDDDPRTEWPSPHRIANTMIGRAHPESTIVHYVRGPVAARRRLLMPDEEPRGVLVLTTDDGSQELVVGERALERGVLLGRYDRCDHAGPRLRDEKVSRVHLMLVSLDGVPHAIDTASRNGTRVREDGRHVRVVRLRADRELVLAHGSTRLRWRPAPGPDGQHQ